MLVCVNLMAALACRPIVATVVEEADRTGNSNTKWKSNST